jgi:hypothetical protein
MVVYNPVTRADVEKIKFDDRIGARARTHVKVGTGISEPNRPELYSI